MDTIIDFLLNILTGALLALMVFTTAYLVGLGWKLGRGELKSNTVYIVQENSLVKK